MYILRTPPYTKLNCDGQPEPVHNNYDHTIRSRSTEYQDDEESCPVAGFFAPPTRGRRSVLPPIFRRLRETKYRVGFSLRA